jgi:hypothetical protein
MHIRYAAAIIAAVILADPFLAKANESDADAAARAYFPQACADGNERIAVYDLTTQSLNDITVGATAHFVAWDRPKFEALCPRPQLYVYHCHTTNDVLTRFPSGSQGASSGDFGSAAEMEFTCAKASVLNGRPAASLVHGLVTRRGEITKYGFTAPTAAAIDEAGRRFGKLLKAAAARGDLAREHAAAEDFFGGLNLEYYARFLRFAMETCPDGGIERCPGFTVERLAAALPPEARMFARADATLTEGPKPAVSNADRPPEGVLPRGGGVAELTPETLGGFVAAGQAMVSICAADAEGLRTCGQAMERMVRLARPCPSVKMAILDQDKHPQARYLYPVARDRSLLLFKRNPKSGLNEQFNLTTMGEPTPELIGLVLCGRAPFGLPGFTMPTAP